MNNFSKNNNWINVLIKWKYVLLAVIIISVILSSIFSGPAFIKPKFKSTAILYPSNLIPYSSETPTEQMLQIFKSDDLQEKIISKFNLIKHYNIDSTEKNYKTKVKKIFENNVKIKKNEYEAVVIEVLDVNPVISCEMVKAMINFFNQKNRELQREKTAEVVVIWENQLKIKQKQVDSIEAKLSELRKNYGLLDYKIQAKESSRQYFKSGSEQGNELFKNLRDKGGELFILSEQLESITKDLNTIKSEYDKAISDLHKELTYTNLISSPMPADKKSYPVRWIIVLISTLSSLIFTVLIIFFIEKIKSENLTNR